MIKAFRQTDIFSKKGIRGEQQHSFTENNIIIGENGSGKTRFLQGVYEYYTNHLNFSKEQVVYAYFPALSGMNKIEPCDMDESLFQSLLANRPQTFDNFVRCIEYDTVRFITELFNPIHEGYRETKERCQKAKEDLNLILRELMGYEISQENLKTKRKKNNDYNIYLNRIKGEKLALEEGICAMSPGERVIFYLSLYLFFLKGIWGKKKKELILILDEPELHLHVKALHKFINMLRKQGIYKQLWIATHSYTLAAEFDFEDLTYIEEGVIQKRNSNLYYDIYKALVGIEDSRLYDFMTDIEKWQYYNFIAECFLLPDSIDKVDYNDIQFKQFLEFVNNTDKPVMVLDYGAGKERLFQCVEMYAERMGIESKTFINYCGYDREWKEADIRGKGWRYNNITKLVREKYKQFDCVVLMNTLHEIDIKEWYSNFDFIGKILKDTGKLLFVEVETLTHGEQPYGESGYLILYEEQLKKLFNTNEIECINLGDEYKKSNAFLISPKQISCVTNNSILEALESLKSQTYERLKQINEIRIRIAHKERIPENEGIMRKYAFYSQLYLNADFAIHRLKMD